MAVLDPTTVQADVDASIAMNARVTADVLHRVLTNIILLTGTVGSVSAPGNSSPAGPQISTLTFPLTNASSFAASHTFARPPPALILDALGNAVETDVLYAPGQVTVVFPEPFTGTLYLG